MRWCCRSSAHSASSSSSNSSTASLQQQDQQQEGKAEAKQPQQHNKALANGGKQPRRRGTKLPLRILSSAASVSKKTQIGGSATAAAASASSGGAERRPAPEGILKGTHQRSGRPPGCRTVQYADGHTTSGDEEQLAGEEDLEMNTRAAEQRPMLAHQDSSPTCSSPSPASSGPSSPRQSPMDQYGPMLLRPCKRALFVLHSASTSSSSSSQLRPPECPFVASLRSAGWEIQACPAQSAREELRRRRPVIILLDGGGHGTSGCGSKELAALADLLRSLHEELDQQHQQQQGRPAAEPASHHQQHPNNTGSSSSSNIGGNVEDVLFGWLLDKVPGERRQRQMAKLRVQQFFLRSSADIGLCEQFSKLSSRLRAVPALFAVVEEAQQPIKICDERNIVQYVNKAYELLTGRSRQTVLGSDGAAVDNNSGGANRNNHGGSQQKQQGPNHVASAAITASATAAAVTAAISWTTVGPGPGTPSTPQQKHPPPPPPLITTTPPMAKAESFGGGGGDDRHAASVKSSSPSGRDRLRLSVEEGGNGGAAVQQQQQQKPDRPPQPPPSPNPHRRRSSDWQCIPVPTSSNSHQYVYVKRGSADAAFFRGDRNEKGRSPGAMVDAPITEALGALGNILHRCDDETQAQLREAMRILSSSELYTPTITRFRENDRIASGYYDGLIRLHHPNRQRKRSVVDAFRDHHQRRVSSGSNISGFADEKSDNNKTGIGSRRRVSTEIMNVLEREQFWDFDVIELERVTDHHPLSSLGLKVFERWSVCEALHCSPDVLHKWLAVIEANYQSGNAYHNATHAADVLQATSYFLNSDPVGQLIQDQHAPAALIAATVHDLDHPGRGNAFLMNTRQRLALLYNDHSILENHHVALAFQLTLSQPGVNIFAQMPREEFTQTRQAIIDMVLATDMSRHFEHLAKFQQLMAILPAEADDNGDRDANSLIICRMMVKCADIANPTREWRLCHQWALRIVEEYFDQTAEEIARKLPVTMKGFDRETCNVPLTQCTFADMFARETFSLWCEFADLPHLITHLEENYARWKAQSAEWDSKRNANLLLQQQQKQLQQLQQK